VGFVDFVDRVGQLTTTPVFQAMYGAAGFLDHLGVTLDHSPDLFGLVGMNHEHYFIVTHLALLVGLLPGFGGAFSGREAAGVPLNSEARSYVETPVIN
jgi:hypothetical protein